MPMALIGDLVSYKLLQSKSDYLRNDNDRSSSSIPLPKEGHLGKPGNMPQRRTIRLISVTATQDDKRISSLVLSTLESQ